MDEPGKKELCPLFCTTVIVNVMNGVNDYCASKDKKAAVAILMKVALGDNVKNVGAIRIARSALTKVAERDPVFRRKLRKNKRLRFLA
jgi:alpha-D-ribose 1-methylphosphonate 5-triphosphate synthase subunit PhnI